MSRPSLPLSQRTSHRPLPSLPSLRDLHDAQTRTLADLFSAAAAHGPASAAVEADGRTVSYAHLARWADAVAGALHDLGVRRGDRVALRLPPGHEAVAALLGVVCAGAAYVPLDVRNPPDRDALVLADSQATAFVGDPTPGVPPGLPLLGTGDVAALGDGAAAADAAGADPSAADPAGAAPEPSPERRGPRPDDTAYVIYTSGTTGRPKGVPVRHSSVVSLFAATSGLFSFSATDRWLLFHSLAFDFSVWEVWGALTSGARLVVPPAWSAASPERTLETVVGRRITVLNQTPTAFGPFTAAALRAGARLPDLRYVIFGGERLTPAALLPWTRRFGLDKPHLVNMYGITETTVHATHCQLTADMLTEPHSRVGRPLPGFSTRIVDEAGRDVAPGQRGELWLAGPQVTAGYLNRPEVNAERFVRVPAADGAADLRYYRSGDVVSRLPDGQLAYHGRTDLQVKLRGHRLELGEVEAAVRAHEAVSDAVVWVREYRPGDQRLVCAFVAAADHPSPDARTLRGHVKAVLPPYMRPSDYRRLPHLPRTTNGKVDRAAVVRDWEERRAR